MVERIAGTGTPESAWQPYLRSLTLPALAVTPAPSRAVVVAPHPDDEVLGVGGLLAVLAAAGTQVDLLAVTDGEASHPGGSVPPPELARRRRAETCAALDALAVPARVRHLHLPDGGRDALTEPVAEALALRPGDWLLGPWIADGHPDHEAVGRACVRAAERDGARLLGYPVWTWHWAAPGDPRVPWATAVQVTWPPEVSVRKAAAIAAFGTQIAPLGQAPADAPVLPPNVLDRFARPYEVLFR